MEEEEDWYGMYMYMGKKMCFLNFDPQMIVLLFIMY